MSYKQKRSFSEPSRGLGDSIEKFTKATGIKSVVNKVSGAIGKDCGCGERRDSLNRAFPYKRK
jgi:predicted transcriptional regulator|tara:strand:+ start:2383 stop:2571 length:189 start_codon:yes stop_codon:yes gene_type:complete